MIQRKPLTKRQIQIIESKVAGNTQNDIGKAVYPNATPESAAVLVSRELKKANVQEELQAAFMRHGITIDKAVRPIADGLEAEIEYYDKNGEEHIRIDHTTRLKASGMAFGLMGIKQQDAGTTNNFIVIAESERNEFITPSTI